MIYRASGKPLVFPESRGISVLTSKGLSTSVNKILLVMESNDTREHHFLRSTAFQILGCVWLFMGCMKLSSMNKHMLVKQFMVQNPGRLTVFNVLLRFCMKIILARLKHSGVYSYEGNQYTLRYVQ